MIEKYESENSMMKYQIIFLKFQNFLYKVDIITRRREALSKAHFFDAMAKKTLISKIKPLRNILGAKKLKFLFLKLKSLVDLRNLKRYLETGF